MNKDENPVCLLDIGNESLPPGHKPAGLKFGTNQQQGGLRTSW